MAASKVALVIQEPPYKSIFPSSELPAAERHEEANVPTSLCVQCSQPRVVEVDTETAHLMWAEPIYTDNASGPQLVVLTYGCEWAEASCRGGVTQPIAEDAWKPLPSGNVGVAEVKVGGLRPGKSYAVRVTATLDLQHVDCQAWDLQVLASAPATFTTLPTVPSAVKPPLLVARERKALKVKWNAPDEPGGEDMALTYQLYMSPAPAGWAGPADKQDGGYVEVYQGPDRSFKVTKLVPGARYSFWVLACNSVGYSDTGQVATYTTQATVPAQPEPPRTVSCTPSSITMQWVAPPGNGAAVTNYILERDEGTPAAQLPATSTSSSSGVGFQLAYAGPLQTVLVQGLRSGLHYRFRLRAENDEGCSFWSDCCLATPAPSPPGAPASITITNISQQSATVSWTLPAEEGGAPVLAHEVELQAISRAAADSMGSDWLRIFEGCISACTISSLQPGCTYRVRARCANSAGWGGWCLPMELSTAPDVPGMPGAPVIHQPGTTSLTLTWQPPRHNGGQRISCFLVELLPPGPKMYSGPELPRPISPSVPGALLVHQGEEPVAQVHGLQPGFSYQFRVQACNSLGAGPWSEWSTLGTSADVPSAPMPPALTAPPSSSSLKVTWQAPDAQGSPIQGYVLQSAQQGAVRNGALVSHSESAANLLAMLQQSSENGAVGSSAAPLSASPSSTTLGRGSSTEQAGLENGPGRPAPAPSPASKADPWQQVYQGPALNAEVTGLQPCTRYMLRVAAFNQVGLGGWSPMAAVTTAPAAPASPQEPRVEVLGPHEVKVTWQPPTTDSGAALTGYTVQVATAASSNGGSSPGLRQLSGSAAPVPSGGWQQAATASGEQLSVVVSGLQPGRGYHFRVRAVNACGSSQPSSTVAATTSAAPPSAPPKLGVTQRAAHHVKVRWEEPPASHGAFVNGYSLEVACCQEVQGPASGAGARLSELTDPGAWREVYRGADTQARVPDLQPGLRYCMRVRARNEAGWSAASSVEQFTTALAPPGPPEGLEARLVAVPADAHGEEGGHGVQLRWLPPAPSPRCAAVASYELHARPVAGPGREMKRVVGKATEFVWEELQPGCKYALRVRAAGMEGAGHGAWSEQVEMVMPGHSRGITDSADSMSAASGMLTEPSFSALSAASSSSHPLDRAASSSNHKRLNGSARSGRQLGKKNSKGALLGSTHSETEDSAYVQGLVNGAANGLARVSSSSTAGGGAARSSKISASKLSTAVAVQKRPKASLVSRVMSREVLSAAGLRRLWRETCKDTKRAVAKHKWQVAAVLLIALLAWLVQLGVSYAMGTRGRPARVRSPAYW